MAKRAKRSSKSKVDVWYLLIDREKRTALRECHFVKSSPDTPIASLKKQIKGEESVILRHINASALTAWRCTDPNIDLSEVEADEPLEEVFSEGKVKKLNPMNQRVEELTGVVLIEVPAAGPGEDNFGVALAPSGLEDYKQFFIKVTKWGSFEEGDLRLNDITRAPYTSLVASVTAFQKNLDSHVALSHAGAVEQAKRIMLSAWDLYFKDPETADNSDQNRPARVATTREEAHAYTMADPIWGNKRISAMNKATASSLFYSLLPIENIDSIEYHISSEPWPFSLVTFCEQSETNNWRKYKPKSDYLLMKSGFPRYLVEVQSGDPGPDWPQDLVRMLLQGASIVRFANTKLDAFKKNFVLVCTYFWHNWSVTCYLLFQKQNETKVYFTETTFSLKDEKERLAHGREVYNLLQLLREEGTQIDKKVIGDFDAAVMNAHLKSFHTKGTGRPHEDDGAGDEGGGGRITGSTGGGADDPEEEFRAHGYELQPEPEVIVDERGCVWEPLFQRPANIRVVRRLPRAGEELIAKKVRADSHEPAILELLNSRRPKPEHVIALLDSFRTRSGRWIILPKLETVNWYLTMKPSRIRGKVAPVCWGLIEGLAHLHRLCIAHRDIKPDNLVLDANADYCLKIIDFEFAMRMKDENEEVDDICGAETWMAPEVEKMSGPYSPIKADRWACGRLILHVLDELREEDVVLKAVGSMLKADDPRRRPSMLEWQNWTSSLLIDDMPHGKAASRAVEVIPQVRPRAMEYGESGGDAKRLRDSGIRLVRVH